jgi:hypothetical protein
MTIVSLPPRQNLIQKAPESMNSSSDPIKTKQFLVFFYPRTAKQEIK